MFDSECVRMFTKDQQPVASPRERLLIFDLSSIACNTIHEELLYHCYGTPKVLIMCVVCVCVAVAQSCSAYSPPTPLQTFQPKIFDRE